MCDHHKNTNNTKRRTHLEARIALPPVALRPLPLPLFSPVSIYGSQTSSSLNFLLCSHSRGVLPAVFLPISLLIFFWIFPLWFFSCCCPCHILTVCTYVCLACSSFVHRWFICLARPMNPVQLCRQAGGIYLIRSLSLHRDAQARLLHRRGEITRQNKLYKTATKRKRNTSGLAAKQENGHRELN